MKCLIIDVSSSSRLWLGRILVEAGFSYDEAKNGTEGLEKLRNEKFDLVFFAMFMGDMNGIHFACMLRAKEAGKHLPLIMITSEDNRSILERAVSVGVTEIYSKTHPEQIREFVNKFFVRHGGKGLIIGRVLYVEDSRSAALKTQTLLTSRGMTVTHFTNAETALESFCEHDYDLVLTDVVLDGIMSGLGLLREIRRMEGRKGQIPVLIMTSFDDKARRIELFASGANDYIPKPAIDDELLARVRNQISLKKQFDLNETQYSQLQELSMRDNMTGLYNRHFLMEIAPAKLSEARRHGIALALMLIGIEGINLNSNVSDFVKHEQIFKSFANLFRTSFRAEDVVARVSDNEFVVLLSNCLERDAVCKAELLYNKILHLPIAMPYVTVNFGVAAYAPSMTEEFDDLFHCAAEALKQAKQKSDHQIVVSHPVPEGTEGKMRPETGSAMPSIPNIDVDAGLERLLGNQEAYQLALYAFCSHQSNIVELMLMEIANQNHAAVEQLATQLNVEANNLGMGLLCSRARLLKLALRKQEWQTIDDTLAEVHLLIAQHCVDIKKMLTTEQPSEPEVHLTSLDGIRILLVDDSAVNRMVEGDWLEQTGAIVSYASDGFEAFEMLDMEPGNCDIVLTDIEMPVMNGYELAKKIAESGMGIPVIAITSHEMTAEQCKEKGFVAHVTKPMTEEVLCETVLIQMKKARASQV